MLTGIVIALFAGLVLFGYVPGRKKRRRKENIFYAAALAVSFAVLILYSLSITLPSPTKAIDGIVRMVVPIK